MKSLFVLYRYDTNAYYTLSYAFDSKGILEAEYLYASAKEFTGGKVNFTNAPSIQGFQNFDELKDFVFDLCRERNSDRAVLLTFEQFNEAIDESTNSEELLSNLAGKGESLENLGLEENKGLLGKIFG
jgi:hypothetical protein